ncbi:hypothetical protein [Chitinophaga sp. OAE865]|uniref:hypothetical protein n=1 Tax=Chitinophaga sp. OAE865 TaxID=2817898 RepID=UPI001AE3271D
MKSTKLHYPICCLFATIALFACKKEKLLNDSTKGSPITRQSKDSLETSVEILSITATKDDPALLKFVNKQQTAQVPISFKMPHHD